ncbi:MAG: NusA N-terminal domain-containing protein, partial [Deltaproteobacteria bacterium]|nr:NusA N-terminal domain-containing protein [Deltaproteobacteria bacterium]
MKSDFFSALSQIASEKGVSKDVVIQATEAALLSAYKR